MLKTLKKEWPRESRQQTSEVASFRRRLNGRWGQGIGKLRMLLTISREFGAGINAEARPTTPSGQEHLTDVLLRLHARACQLTDEILCLLTAGFADGAMARWRTLDEIAVVAFFVQKHGEEVAERYIDHQSVESWKAALTYQECHERLGYEPIEPELRRQTEEANHAAIARFGKNFRGDYGWASEALKSKEPTFREIEESVGLDHLRAHYRMAGHNVHANPKGAFFKHGLLKEMHLLLAGPSSFGLTDPGHCTAISLNHVTCTLFDLQPTFDSIVVLRIMSRLVPEIGEAFVEAQRRLEEDEAKHRQSV